MLICHLKNNEVLDFGGICNHVNLIENAKIAEFKTSPYEGVKASFIIPVDNILYIERKD